MVRSGVVKVAWSIVEVFQKEGVGTSILEDFDAHPTHAHNARATPSTAKSRISFGAVALVDDLDGARVHS